MLNRLTKAAKNPFIKNVTTLASGTIISQIVVVASSPLLARQYSVEAFGLLSVFTSVCTFFAVVSTGRYEYAVGLPDSDEKALKIMRLIFTIGLFVSLSYLSIILVLKIFFEVNDPVNFLNHGTSYIAPFYILFVAFNSALGYWYQRRKNYKVITFTNASQVIITTIFSIIFGFLKWDKGMIVSLLIGVSFTTVHFLKKDKELLKLFRFEGGLRAVAKEYISFPKFMIFSDLSKTASQQIIPILFSTLFSTTVVGFFSLSNRMLRLPNIVITSAIANVFRNDAIDEIREKGNCVGLYKSTFKKLAFISVPIYVMIFIFAPIIFEVIFGSKWLMAGYFARILSVLLLVEFIATPLSSVFYIREKQKIFMNIQFLNVIFGSLAIYLGAKYFDDPLYSLAFFSLNALIFNLIILIYSYRISNL